MHDFVAAVRGLTVRGRSFLAAGGACVASAAVIGEQDLLAVGLLLVAMPLFAAAFVSRTRYRLACTRRLEPRRVTAGDRVAVRIRLDNVSRLSSSVLLVEDSTPPMLGQRARFVLDRIEPGGTRDLSYSLRAQARGRYQVGPLGIRLTDPFGLCELARSFRSHDELVVAPTIEKLPRARPVGAASQSTEVHLASAMTGDDESTTRPYLPGDDLRRVHWKTTARLGELMVRREERPLTGAATVLLDNRTVAWPEPAEPEVFTWAVSAAGSIAVHLARSGYGVRLVTGAGVAAAASGAAVGPLLDELAVVSPAPSASLSPALATLRRIEHGGLAVAVLGCTDPATTTMIAGARPRNAPAIAVLVDLASWGVSPTAAGDLDATRLALSRSGWTVLVTNPDTRLVEAWPQVVRPGWATGRRHHGGWDGAAAGVPQPPAPAQQAPQRTAPQPTLYRPGSPHEPAPTGGLPVPPDDPARPGDP